MRVNYLQLQTDCVAHSATRQGPTTVMSLMVYLKFYIVKKR